MAVAQWLEQACFQKGNLNDHDDSEKENFQYHYILLFFKVGLEVVKDYQY